MNVIMCRVCLLSKSVDLVKKCDNLDIKNISSISGITVSSVMIS